MMGQKLTSRRKSIKIPKKLYIWDFDDTLAITNGHVKITKSNGKKLFLTSEQYGRYVAAPDDAFDFSEFSNPENIKEIPEMMSRFRKTMEKYGSKAMVILSARQDVRPIRHFIKTHKIPRIRAVALADFGHSLKAKWILKEARRQKYDIIEFFDDNRENIKEIRAIRDKIPAKVILHHVKTY